MRRILFVDDEPAILAGLRRSLRAMRQEWQMEFTESATEAIDILSGSAFDVIVTDMRMPGMDGVALLTHVKHHHPSTVRIVLSGHTERASTMRATGVAHQYLAKPTDPGELMDAIKRATALEDMLSNQRVIEAAGGLDALPPMPALYAEVARELASDDPALDHVAEIVARDPGMAAKVVQIVNSSFFGIRTRITNPVQAVTLLGLDTVVGLILTGPFHASDGGSGDDSRWMAGLATGTLAREIAGSAGLDRKATDDAYLAGLLHDCGRTVVAARLPADFSAIEPDRETGSVLESEHRLLGATHAEIGGFMLAVWGLPSTVVEAVAFHHRPSDAIGSGFGVLTAVHAAAVIVSRTHGDHVTCPDEQHLTAVGMLDRFAEWQAAYEPPKELAS